MKKTGAGEAYHTALAGGEAAASAQPTTRWEHAPSGSVALVHDVFRDLPPEFAACDAFYSDPPWRRGFDEFNRRAGAYAPGDPAAPTWASLVRRLDYLARTLAAAGKAVVYTGGREFLRLASPSSVSGPVTLNGDPCRLIGYGVTLPPVFECPTAEAALAWMAGRFSRVGDFLCGYGRAGRVFARAGKPFTLADYNAACIGYVASHAAEWFPGA